VEPLQVPGENPARSSRLRSSAGVSWVRSLIEALPSRIWAISGILAAELAVIAAVMQPWLQARTFTASSIILLGALLFFGREKLRIFPIRNSHVSLNLAVLHACFLAMALLSAGCALPFFSLQQTWQVRAATAGFYVAVALLPASLAAALFTPPGLIVVARRLGSGWVWAALCVVAGIGVLHLPKFLWIGGSLFSRSLKAATFLGVRMLLGQFYSHVISDPASLALGTESFEVRLETGCSGIEGLAMMLVLTVGWLIFTRRELRIGRAILLVPISLALIWLLNLVRIASLIAIGNAGYPAIAGGGFHSEAGWIVFNVVAIGFLLAASQVSWVRKTTPSLPAGARSLSNRFPEAVRSVEGSRREVNLAAVYLVPFLAIIAASLVSQAASGGFEWLYPLRFIAALCALFVFRREYRRMDWGFGWLGPAAGLAVFAMWVALDRWMGSRGSQVAGGLGAALAHMTLAQRIGWVAVRATAAVVTVPLAEELAFRGYVARRLISATVETVDYRCLTPWSILLSSLAFGLMHGHMWLAGIVAGTVFALVARLRGRLGEAVVAHGTANLLIAILVLASGNYSLW
jgi:exosortase E/protease (VPEID-CTERM system)